MSVMMPIFKSAGWQTASEETMGAQKTVRNLLVKLKMQLRALRELRKTDAEHQAYIHTEIDRRIRELSGNYIRIEASLTDLVQRDWFDKIYQKLMDRVTAIELAQQQDKGRRNPDQLQQSLENRLNEIELAIQHDKGKREPLGELFHYSVTILAVFLSWLLSHLLWKT
jgi:hypothetical protein